MRPKNQDSAPVKLQLRLRGHHDWPVMPTNWTRLLSVHRLQGGAAQEHYSTRRISMTSRRAIGRVAVQMAAAATATMKRISAIHAVAFTNLAPSTRLSSSFP